MNYQGDNPNAPQERQQTATGYQQSGTQQGTPQQSQGFQQSGRTGTNPQQQYQQQYQQSPQGGQQQPGYQQQQPGGQQTTYAQSHGASQMSQPGTGQQMGGMGAQQAAPQGAMQQQQQAGGRGGRQRPQFSPATVDEVIRTDVVTAQRDTPIATVAGKMAEKNVGDVIVVEDDGQTPVGIVTDRKVALALEQTPDIAERKADDLVSGDLVTGTTEMTVFDALERLSQEDIRRLPIVDQDGKLQGIVTLDDILILFGNQLQNAVDIIGTQAERVK